DDHVPAGRGHRGRDGRVQEQPAVLAGRQNDIGARGATGGYATFRAGSIADMNVAPRVDDRVPAGAGGKVVRSEGRETVDHEIASDIDGNAPARTHVVVEIGA